jgi:hypothetical protein
MMWNIIGVLGLISWFLGLMGGLVVLTAPREDEEDYDYFK